MSSDLEQEIQMKVHALPEDQQRQVLNVVEDFCVSKNNCGQRAGGRSGKSLKR